MKIIIKIIFLFILCPSAFADAPENKYKIIVDIGPNISQRGFATLKTAQLLGGDGLVESIKANAPEILESNLIVILEKIESNGFLTKYEISYMMIYGEKKFVCDKNIETGFAPGGSYTVNRPKVAFESTSKDCMKEFFNK